MPASWCQKRVSALPPSPHLRNRTQNGPEQSRAHRVCAVPRMENERSDLWEIAEEYYQSRSTILNSQILVIPMHQQIGDPRAAYGILTGLSTIRTIETVIAAKLCGLNLQMNQADSSLSPAQSMHQRHSQHRFGKSLRFDEFIEAARVHSGDGRTTDTINDDSL